MFLLLSLSVKPDPRSWKLLPPLPHPIKPSQLPEEIRAYTKGNSSPSPAHTMPQSFLGKEGEGEERAGLPQGGWGGPEHRAALWR